MAAPAPEEEFGNNLETTLAVRNLSLGCCTVVRIVVGRSVEVLYQSITELGAFEQRGTFHLTF